MLRGPFRIVSRWTAFVPLLSLVLLIAIWPKPPRVLLVVAAVFLAGAVLAAVHHAEVIAHRVGEPAGSLVLALAVTVIEASLILTLMVSGGEQEASLARDTVFAAVMITANGIVGVSLLLVALRERVAAFNLEATATMLATVATLATLTLVLPTFTTSSPGPTYSPTQLAFASVASLVLYLVFVWVQTVRHREDYAVEAPGAQGAHDHAPPTRRDTVTSLVLLLVALVAVVGLAKVESGAIADAVDAIGAPPSAVGVAVALLVLLPEGLAAARNAYRGRTQASLNLAFGSGVASIGLTIPVIALASIWVEGPLVLGLDDAQIVLLAITVLVGTLTVLPGRATIQEAVLHLVLFAAFIVFAVNP